MNLHGFCGTGPRIRSKKEVNDHLKKALDTGYHFSVRKATDDVPNFTRTALAFPSFPWRLLVTHNYSSLVLSGRVKKKKAVELMTVK